MVVIFMRVSLRQDAKNKMARGDKRNPGHVTPDASRRVGQRGGDPGEAAIETSVRNMGAVRG